MREMRGHVVRRWGDNSQPQWFTRKSFTLGLLTQAVQYPCLSDEEVYSFTPALHLEIELEVGGPRLGVNSMSM